MGSVATAFAHALPGSVLTFSHQDDRLVLSISLPTKDLIIAAPELAVELAGVEQAHGGGEVSERDVAALAEYFADHLSVQQSSVDLEITLLRASTQTAFNEHVGEFELLDLGFEVELGAAAPVFPMTLYYDAVMHEVRNHRAQVYWMGNESQPVGLAEFGYRAVNGAPVPVPLRLP